MTRHRLVLYILVNVLVSALVSGAILFYYDHANHKTDCVVSEMVPTLTSSGVNAEIVSVTGVGVLASESITIQNNGNTEFLMTGWTLKDNQGSTYTFPQLTLYPGGKVQVHTGVGTDTSADLYWQRSAPVWVSGELAALYDTQNIVRAFYRIP